MTTSFPIDRTTAATGRMQHPEQSKEGSFAFDGRKLLAYEAIVLHVPACVLGTTRHAVPARGHEDHVVVRFHEEM